MKVQIKKIIFLLILFLFLFGAAMAEGFLEWEPGPHRLDQYPKKDITITIAFKGASFAPSGPALPYYIFDWEGSYNFKGDAKTVIDSLLYRPANSWEEKILRNYENEIGNDFVFTTQVNEFRKSYNVRESLLPIRKSKDGGFELLTFFKVSRSYTASTAEKYTSSVQTNSSNKQNLNESFLSYGKTLKIGVELNGIYKVSYSDLIKGGLISGPIESSKLALYGIPAGMLPTTNPEDFVSGLASLPILVEDKQDGMFSEGDYFLFYGQSPVVWTNDGEFFTHIQHSYSDRTFYFIGVNHKETPNRISTKTTADIGSANKTITTFTDFVVYEKDIVNLAKGGQNWHGEAFNVSGDKHNFNFSLKDINLSESFSSGGNVFTTIYAAGITQHGTGILNIKAGSESFSLTIPSTTSSGSAIVITKVAEAKISKNIHSNTPDFSISMDYTKSGNVIRSHLDYIEINYKRNLSVSRGDLNFRSIESMNAICKYEISGDPDKIQIWDVTNPTDIKNINLNKESGKVSFADGENGENAVLKEYIAFDGLSYKFPSFMGTIDTQNLLAYSGIEYVVVSSDEFMEQAKEITTLHKDRNGYSVLAIPVSKIYNEFSAGIPDPSSIRFFIKSLYDKSVEGQIASPKYLLLLGKASFDVKGRLGKKTCFIPTFEVPKALNEEASATDDIFAYMGVGEGLKTSPSSSHYSELGALDIAVGRLPVRTVSDAKNAVNKIDVYSNRNYLSLEGWDQKPGNLGDWRHEISFVTDDGFEANYEGYYDFTGNILNSNSDINIEKIYADAFIKESSAVTSSFPQSIKDIKSRMNRGGLFVGYIGHSGWDSWGDEKYLTMNDIHQWEPILSYPMMFSSSCTFSYYDQPDKLSAGEETVLHEQGGAISMIAASRSASSGGQIEYIQRDFIAEAVNKSGYKLRTIGDAFLYSKNKNKNYFVSLFILLGDPGLKVAIPEHDVKTLTINGKSVNESTDTLKAFSKIEITGQIESMGVLKEDFNGNVQIKVFDKISKEFTKGNPQGRGGPDNPKVEYELRKNIIYKGSAKVENGKFTFSFIVPKDIAYNFGEGKISYYAYSDTNSDAGGSFYGITVGGFNSDMQADTSAPSVKLYINKGNFLPESYSGASPVLYAEIKDNYGLNTTGVGIGHDMLLIIDGDYKNAIVVNDLFTYNTNSYSEGTLVLPLNLSEGMHDIELKVWNIFNISGSGSLKFGVDSSDIFKITEFRISPNPCRTEGEINFNFTHNGIGGIDHYEIQIYDLFGNRVGLLKGSESSTYGYSVGPIIWNINRADKGELPKGIYIVRLLAYNKDGEMSKAVSKLIVG